MKVSTGHAVYIGDATSKHQKPPLSPEAIHAIYLVGRVIHGTQFQPWTPEYRQEVYDARRRMAEPIGANTYRCRGCGCMISVKERCKPCQEVFRRNGYREEVSA